ncbi:MAG: CRISPR-associated endonuclease Cas2 [Magnetococcales bacterium]|nr:CRISPR-associated endonuclease Cas2 [Magnetococcales bacterium]
MRTDHHRYVICYDISDNKRRRRLAICLDQYGDRIQESVFEAVLDRDLLHQMISEISKKIKVNADAVRIYTLCATCAPKVERLGIPGPVPGEETVFVV